jgi:hypothetical protein
VELMTSLADLTRMTGLPVAPHLMTDLVIPADEGMQAQGDLLVVPLTVLAGRVFATDGAGWTEVPPSGVQVLRGVAGGNPHTLVADPGTCLWTPDVADADGLAIALVDALAPVYLLHREHGGTGIAPGRYAIRRQRELVRPEPARVHVPDGTHQPADDIGQQRDRLMAAANVGVRWVAD